MLFKYCHQVFLVWSTWVLRETSVFQDSYCIYSVHSLENGFSFMTMFSNTGMKILQQLLSINFGLIFSAIETLFSCTITCILPVDLNVVASRLDIFLDSAKCPSWLTPSFLNTGGFLVSRPIWDNSVFSQDLTTTTPQSQSILSFQNSIPSSISEDFTHADSDPCIAPDLQIRDISS